MNGNGERCVKLTLSDVHKIYGDLIFYNDVRNASRELDPDERFRIWRDLDIRLAHDKLTLEEKLLAVIAHDEYGKKVRARLEAQCEREKSPE